MIKAIFFDLDGTLLSMDQAEFIERYMRALSKYLAQFGYDPKKLVPTVWNGCKAMIANDGSVLNTVRFWKPMEDTFGQEKCDADQESLLNFYRTDFQSIADTCEIRQKAVDAVKKLKEQYPLVLATNPLFPSIATCSRVRWAGLNPEDFVFISHYENSHYAKPNPKYFMEIADRMHLKPEEILMVGNDYVEDGAAEQCGMHLFFIEDGLLNDTKENRQKFPTGSFDDLLCYVKQMEQAEPADNNIS